MSFAFPSYLADPEDSDQVIVEPARGLSRKQPQRPCSLACRRHGVTSMPVQTGHAPSDSNRPVLGCSSTWRSWNRSDTTCVGGSFRVARIRGVAQFSEEGVAPTFWCPPWDPWSTSWRVCRPIRREQSSAANLRRSETPFQRVNQPLRPPRRRGPGKPLAVQARPNSHPFSAGESCPNLRRCLHRCQFALAETRGGCIDRREFGRSPTRTLLSILGRFWAKCAASRRMCRGVATARRKAARLPAGGPSSGSSRIPKLNEVDLNSCTIGTRELH
jgi:hypothetical protein